MSHEIQLYKNLVDKIGDKATTSLLDLIEAKSDKKFEDKKEVFATKKDLAELEVRVIRQIYISSVIQFIAIVGSVLAIVRFIV